MNMYSHIHLTRTDLEDLKWLSRNADTPYQWNSLTFKDARYFFYAMLEETDTLGILRITANMLDMLCAVRSGATEEVALMIDSIFIKHLGSNLKGLNA